MATLIGPRPAEKARDVVRRRLDAALDEIDKPGPLGPRLHEARLDLKKARATLKLLRPSIGRRSYRRENVLCREAGRILRRMRDAQALSAAWRKFHLNDPAIARRLSMDARHAARPGEIKKSRELVEVAREQAKKLAPARADWKGIEKGLQRSYADSKRAWERARREGEEQAFHEWRKRVKDERYQLDLLTDGEQELARFDERLVRLSDLLGDEHDLSILRERVGERSVEVRRSIERLQSRLRGQALSLADPLYAASPKEFVRRVRRAFKKAA